MKRDGLFSVAECSVHPGPTAHLHDNPVTLSANDTQALHDFNGSKKEFPEAMKEESMGFIVVYKYCNSVVLQSVLVLRILDIFHCPFKAVILNIRIYGSLIFI